MSRVALARRTSDRMGSNVAKRKPHPDYLPKDVVALIKKAKRFGEHGPKQHHLVPAFYLAQWARDGVLTMSDLDERRAVHVQPKDAAKRSQFYSLDSEDLDPAVVPPLMIEYILSEIEGQAKPLLERLADDPSSLSSEEFAVIAGFLGFQSVRGARTQEGIRESVGYFSRLTAPVDASDEYLSQMLADGGEPATPDRVAAVRDGMQMIADGTVRMAPRKAAVVGLAMQNAQTVGYLMYRRPWVVYDTPPILITTDEPVVPVSGPGGNRRERGGAGVAGVIMFPLRPDRLLVMPRPDLAWVHHVGPARVSRGTLDHLELAQVNKELAAHAHRYTFEVPTKRVGLRVSVPATVRATRGEDVTGKVVVVEDDGNEQVQEIHRLFTPNRWADAEIAPSWPVSRWWPRGALTPDEYMRENSEELEFVRAMG